MDEEDGSCMLWLPDLVLARLIDYLLPSSEAHGRVPQAHVPSHKRSLNSALGGLGGWHSTAASTLYDDVDQYGQRTLRSRMSSVLALRATCRSLWLTVDMIVRLPPLDFVPHLQAWLAANLGTPPLQLTDNNNNSSAEGSNDYDFDWAARLVSSSAHAQLQQLRLDEVLTRMFQGWKGRNAPAKLAELRQTLLSPLCDSSAVATSGNEDLRGRLKVLHFDHHSDFIGSDGGQTVESVLSLLLPGQPDDLVEIVLICDYCQSEEGPSTALEVEFRTDSRKWSSLPGMGESPTGVPLLRYDGDYEGDKDLLLRLWSSLGFEVPRKTRGAESDDSDGTKWRTEEVAAVLLACLGFEFESNLEGISTNSFESCIQASRFMGQGSARARELIKRRQQSTAFLASWEHMLENHVRPCLSSLGRAQRAVVWELVARTVERTIGQIRLSSRISASMLYHQINDTWGISSSRLLAQAPSKVLEGLVVLGCHSVEVLSEHVGISGYTSSCVRLLCRFPAGDWSAEATRPRVSSGHLIFRCEHNRGTSDEEGLLRITVEAIGEELQRALLDADPREQLQQALRDSSEWNEEEEAEGSEGTTTTMATTHALLNFVVDIPGQEADADENVAEVATDKLVLVGRLLGMTAPPTKEKRPLHEEEIEFAQGVARLLLFASNLSIWGLSDCLSKIDCALLRGACGVCT